MSPFEVVHGYQPRQPIDLIPMVPHHTRMSESAASFASTAEFAYNSSVNRTISMSPFEVVHGYQPRQPIYLIELNAPKQFPNSRSLL